MLLLVLTGMGLGNCGPALLGEANRAYVGLF